MKRVYAITLAVGIVFGLALRPGLADQSDPRLPDLFDELLSAKEFSKALPAEQEIWRIWITSDDNAVAILMREGSQAMSERNFSRALGKFNQIVAIAPQFAEGWNKRATLYYLMGDYEASLADIEKTLALEPRHFGALAGRGLVYASLENLELALESFEAALKVHPTSPGSQRNAEFIRKQLKDSEI